MNSSRDLSNKSARLSNTRFYCLNKLPWLSEIYKIIQEIIGSGNSACQIITSKQEHTRRKICQNTGFLWPVYFRITAESLILSLNGKRRHRKLVFWWHILRSDIKVPLTTGQS